MIKRFVKKWSEVEKVGMFLDIEQFHCDVVWKVSNFSFFIYWILKIIGDKRNNGDVE
jgi:hypothetical protein